MPRAKLQFIYNRHLRRDDDDEVCAAEPRTLPAKATILIPSIMKQAVILYNALIVIAYTTLHTNHFKREDGGRRRRTHTPYFHTLTTKLILFTKHN